MSNPELQIKSLLDLTHTIAADLFLNAVYPWDVLGRIGEYIVSVGKSLPADQYDEVSECVWISKKAKVFSSAYIIGPCIIDAGAEVRHCAFIRGNALVGKNCVVGNSTELKNVILFDGVQVPHYNYVGDSVLGYKAHMGAGAITSNVKGDKTLVKVSGSGYSIDTNRKKFGAILGDYAEIGCNSVLNPGTVICRRSRVYPCSSVRGVVPEGCIYKKATEIVAVKEDM